MAFPSTFLDLQRSVIAKARLDADADAASGPDLQKAKDWINQAYAQVCVETETNQGLGTAVLSPGATTYQLPPEILRIRAMLLQTAGSTTYGPPMEETTLDDILTLRQGDSASSGTGPSRYALAGLNVLDLWPTPASEDTLLFYYVGPPTALSATSDIPVLQEPYASKLIEYGALAEAADYLKDPDVDKYRALYDMWMKKFRTHLARRAGSHVRSIPTGRPMVTPHDPSTDVRGYWSW